MEIERKFLLKQLPDNTKELTYQNISQGYLNTSPVLRIRQKNDQYIFTYKSAGLMSREEIEVPLTKEAYTHLLPKCDGNIITKTRYLCPLNHQLTAELDQFYGCYSGLFLAEVEFPSEAEANAFVPPSWFGPEVTQDTHFHNSTMSQTNHPEEILALAKSLLQ